MFVSSKNKTFTKRIFFKIIWLWQKNHKDLTGKNGVEPTLFAKDLPLVLAESHNFSSPQILSLQYFISFLSYVSPSNQVLTENENLSDRKFIKPQRIGREQQYSCLRGLITLTERLQIWKGILLMYCTCILFGSHTRSWESKHILNLQFPNYAQYEHGDSLAILR